MSQTPVGPSIPRSAFHWIILACVFFFTTGIVTGVLLQQRNHSTPETHLAAPPAAIPSVDPTYAVFKAAIPTLLQVNDAWVNACLEASGASAVNYFAAGDSICEYMHTALYASLKGLSWEKMDQGAK